MIDYKNALEDWSMDYHKELALDFIQLRSPLFIPWLMDASQLPSDGRDVIELYIDTIPGLFSEFVRDEFNLVCHG